MKTPVSAPASDLPKSTSEKHFWVAEIPESLEKTKSYSSILFLACVALLISKVALSIALMLITKGDLPWLAISISSISVQSAIFAFQLKARALLSKFAIMEMNRAYHLYLLTTSIGFIGVVVDCALVLGSAKLFDGYWMLLFLIIETAILLHCFFLIEFRITVLEEVLFENYKIERILGDGKLSGAEEEYLEAHRPGFLTSNDYRSIKREEDIKREKEEQEK